MENWSDWWKIGQICGKLVRLVENWSDWWKTGQIGGKLVRLVENGVAVIVVGVDAVVVVALLMLPVCCSC